MRAVPQPGAGPAEKARGTGGKTRGTGRCGKPAQPPGQTSGAAYSGQADAAGRVARPAFRPASSAAGHSRTPDRQRRPPQPPALDAAGVVPGDGGAAHRALGPVSLDPRQRPICVDRRFSVRKEDATPSIDLLGGLMPLGGGSGPRIPDILYEYIRSQDMVEKIDQQLDHGRAFRATGRRISSLPLIPKTRSRT